jgi:hypothetical protein
MSQFRYDRQFEPDPGWSLWRLLGCLVALVVLGPAVVLGALGLVAWRYVGWRHRWVRLLFLLSLAPAAAAAYVWRAIRSRSSPRCTWWRSAPDVRPRPAPRRARR